MPAVVVVGSVHMDLIATAPRLPRRGETMRGVAFASHPGGKGGNQAVQAAVQGSPTALIGRVGRDAFGNRLLDALRTKGVDTGFVLVDDAAPTGVSTVLVGEDGDYASVIVPGASMGIDRSQIDAARPAIESCRVLLAQLEIEPEAVGYAMRMAKEAGKIVVLNAAPAPDGDRACLADLWSNVDVLVVNRGEAAALRPGATSDDDRPTKTAQALRQALGVPAVVVTIGAAGAVLAEASGERAVAGLPVPVVDAVGAGDAFVGTLASRMAGGVDLAAAVADANAAGALAVTRAGAYDALARAAEVADFQARTEAASPADRVR